MAEETAAPHELLYKRQVSSAGDFLPESRFEQWSELVANFGVKLTNNRAPSEVTGEYSSILGQNGVFYDWRDSENIVFQNPDKSADSCIILHYSVQGHSEVAGPKRGQSFRMAPGSLSLHDTTQPITKQWSGGRDLYLMLPYESASHALGGKLMERCRSTGTHLLCFCGAKCNCSRAKPSTSTPRTSPPCSTVCSSLP